MAGWLSFVLVAIASVTAMVESRVIPTEPISVMLDAYGNPMMFLREKRTAVHPYPQRAMMFTGYYRPVRRSNNGGQATGVFAQGNSVSGETFFGGMPHLKGGPEPIEEPEVSSAEAQAAPEESEETYNEEEQRHQEQQPHHQEHHHHHQQEEEEQHHRDEHHHRHHQDSLKPQEHHEPEQIPSVTEITQPAEEPIAASTEVSATRPKVHSTKKTQKTPVIVDDDDDEDEADEEDDEPVMPFVPFKGNRRRQEYPNLNNFFPMVFSFPRVGTRARSSGSPPGTITAIANSYSTGKGGVASSVATAYGGPPNGKKRRSQPSEE